MESITCEELSKLDSSEILLIDVRDSGSYEYGHISGAINVPFDSISDCNLPENKKLVVYCRNGKTSREAVNRFVARGFDACELYGGYAQWMKYRISDMSADTAAKVEEGLRKKFSKKLFSKFAKAIVEYKLIEPEDRIAVCISGGKDSMLMAKLFQELKRHNKFPFELKFLVMDPGYSAENRELIEANAKLLNIPVTIFETNIFENVFNIEKSPCYICARMRRGYLYSKAKELGCNKIALGHHYDDVIETILMGMLYGAQMQTMMPRVDSANFEGMRLIRPMYLIRESDIVAWRDHYNLRFLQCACKFTESNYSERYDNYSTGSKRKKVKELISMLAKDDPEIEQNIFKSAENVNLSTIISYKDKEGKIHRYSDEDGN